MSWMRRSCSTRRRKARRSAAWKRDSNCSKSSPESVCRMYDDVWLENGVEAGFYGEIRPEVGFYGVNVSF